MVTLTNIVCDMQIRASICNASSEYNENFECQLAIDGLTTTSWMMQKYGDENPWIHLELGNLYKINAIEFTHNSNVTEEMFKELLIEFSDGIKENIFLSNASLVNMINITNSWPTRYLKITVINSYDTYLHDTGFAEIKMFGCYESKLLFICYYNRKTNFFYLKLTILWHRK